MNFQSIVFIGFIIELCFVDLLDAKRSFGIQRSRSKSKTPSVRRNGHGHEYDDAPLPPPKPSAPDMKKLSNTPQGPPPAYPGLGHHNVPHHNAPPAYPHPPGYSQGFAPPPGGFNNFGASPYSGIGGGVGAMPPMGVMPIAFQPQRSAGSGMMTNLFAGLAGYQLARAFTGGHHHHDREVIVIDNRNQPAEQQPNVEQPPIGELPLNVPKAQTQQNQHPMASSTEIPQEPISQVGPANNEYTHYGIPQYGLPLYGYSMPSQTTSYYQSATMNLSPQPPPATGIF